MVNVTIYSSTMDPMGIILTIHHLNQLWIITIYRESMDPMDPMDLEAVGSTGLLRAPEIHGGIQACAFQTENGKFVAMDSMAKMEHL